MTCLSRSSEPEAEAARHMTSPFFLTLSSSLHCHRSPLSTPLGFYLLRHSAAAAAAPFILFLQLSPLPPRLSPSLLHAAQPTCPRTVLIVALMSLPLPQSPFLLKVVKVPRGYGPSSAGSPKIAHFACYGQFCLYLH